MNQAVIGLGSNIDAKKNISFARSLLAKTYTVVAESRVLRTKPVGYLDQPDFLNSAVLIETGLDRTQVDEDLKKMEMRLGRQKGRDRDGPRTIDLDILVWNGDVVDKDVCERSYLRESILELLPGLNL